MGCHTWFCTKLEIQPSYEELREKYLMHLKKEIGYYQRHISNTLDKDEMYLFENKTAEDSKRIMGILERKYMMIYKRYCKLATVRKYVELQHLYFSERNYNIYEYVKNAHDIFRIYNYPKDELLSMKETLEFFEKNNERIFWGYNPSFYGKDKVIEMVQDFWNKHPNGMIRFG